MNIPQIKDAYILQATNSINPNYCHNLAKNFNQYLISVISKHNYSSRPSRNQNYYMRINLFSSQFSYRYSKMKLQVGNNNSYDLKNLLLKISKLY